MRTDEIRELVNRNKEEFIKKWMVLASVVGTAKEKTAMDKTCETIREMFEAEGFKCRREKSGAGTPDVLIGIRGNNKDYVLFSGHYDTVFSEKQNIPIEATSDRILRGPGVLDMKGGIITALFTARILSELGLESIPLKIVFVGDEEIGHDKSSSAEILKEESRDALWALNLETGFENDDFCIGRKGTATCIIKTKGRASHPGNAFEVGRNAVLEMANKIVAVSNLTDLKRGMTVSIGNVHGGTVANTVPEECCAEVDLRFSSLSDFDFLKKSIAGICEKPVIQGTETKVSYKEILPPYETTDEILRLFEKFKGAALRLGQGEIKGHIRGGASDAAYIGQTGVPVICAAGVSGSGSHSHDEWADMESLSRRTALFTLVIEEELG